MRYFLPILPVLCILGVAVLRTQMKAASMGPRAIAYSLIAGCLLSTLWVTFHPTGDAGASQILSLYVLVGTLFVALLALLIRTSRTAGLSVIVFALGLGVAGANLITDVSHSQKRREDIALIPDFETRLNDNVVIFDRIVMSALGERNQLLALSHYLDGPHPELVSQALDAGMTVALPRQSAMDHLAGRNGIEITSSRHGLGPDYVEVIRSADLSP